MREARRALMVLVPSLVFFLFVANQTATHINDDWTQLKDLQTTQPRKVEGDDRDGSDGGKEETRSSKVYLPYPDEENPPGAPCTADEISTTKLTSFPFWGTTMNTSSACPTSGMNNQIQVLQFYHACRQRQKHPVMKWKDITCSPTGGVHKGGGNYAVGSKSYVYTWYRWSSLFNISRGGVCFSDNYTWSMHPWIRSCGLTDSAFRHFYGTDEYWEHRPVFDYRQSYYREADAFLEREGLAGKEFLAVHLRKGDYEKFCREIKRSYRKLRLAHWKWAKQRGASDIYTKHMDTCSPSRDKVISAINGLVERFGLKHVLMATTHPEYKPSDPNFASVIKAKLHWFDPSNYVMSAAAYTAMDSVLLAKLCGNNQFQLSFVSSLLTDSLGEGGECTPYCTFWADHSQGTDDWITNIEPWKLSVKATVASSYVVPLLDDFFGLALPEAGKDPVIAAHLASAIIRRYHTVSLTSSTMTELQPLLLRRLYQLVDASPQLVVLAEKDITAALRQQHISNPQHRSPSLSAAVSSTYMQYVLHTTRPKAGDEVLAPKPPSRESLTIFTELIGALYDTIDVLSKRAAPQKSAPPNLPPARTTPIVDMVVYGTQRRMYDTQNYPLFPTPPQPRPSRRGRTTRQQVHEAMEAQYTVWNAAEAVNALLLTAVTMALRHSAFLPQAVSLCHAVIAAGEQRVLPPAVTQSAASQLVWLERPASAAALLLRPSPACGAAPLAADHTAPIFAFVPHCLRDTADLRL